MLLAAVAHDRRELAGINDEIKHLSAHHDPKGGTNRLAPGSARAQVSGHVADLVGEVGLPRGHEFPVRRVVPDCFARGAMQHEESANQGHRIGIGEGSNRPQLKGVLKVREVEGIVQHRRISDLPGIA